MIALLEPLAGYIAGAVGLLALLWGPWRGGEASGKRKMLNKVYEDRIAAQEKHKEKTDEVDSLDAAALDKRGRRWVRPDPEA